MNTIVFDWETTGLNLHPRAGLDKQPRAIEFGAVLLDDKGKTLEEIDILINPGIPLDYDIQRITGLRDADLADQPTFAKALPKIAPLFKAAHTMLSHNLPFDFTILTNELSRLQKPYGFMIPPRGICTVQTYRERYGRNPKLTELYEDIIGKKLEQTHRALDDVHALVEIVVKEGLYK